MAEEKGLEVDCHAYEEAKKQAQLRSQGTGGAVDDKINLDVHAINHLQQQKFPPTDDLHKYKYTADNGHYSECYIVSSHEIIFI